MTNLKYIKYIGLALVLMLSTLSGLAQDQVKNSRKLKRIAKKEARAQALEANKERILELIADRTFVIEASTLFDRYQNRYEVSPNVNFIMITGEQGVVQFGFNHIIGYNGVGGLTFDGNISGFKVLNSKPKGPVTISTNLSAPGLLGVATLNMTIHADGRANATIVGSFGSRLTFAGNVYHPEESTVYQGLSVL